MVSGVGHPLGVRQEVSARGVSRFASSSFPLGVPTQGLSCGTRHRLHQRLPYYIHPDFPLPISRSAGICCVLSHKLILLIVSGHCTFRILQRQLSMKDLVTVALIMLLASAPYSKTGWSWYVGTILYPGPRGFLLILSLYLFENLRREALIETPSREKRKLLFKPVGILTFMPSVLDRRFWLEYIFNCSTSHVIGWIKYL